MSSQSQQLGEDGGAPARGSWSGNDAERAEIKRESWDLAERARW